MCDSDSDVESCFSSNSFYGETKNKKKSGEPNIYEKLISLSFNKDTYCKFQLASDTPYYKLVEEAENASRNMSRMGWQVRWALYDLFLEAQKLACYSTALYEDQWKREDETVMDHYEKQKSQDYVKHVAEMYDFFCTLESYMRT